MLDVGFESYAADRAGSRERVFGFLGIPHCGGENQSERYPINSSFDNGPRPAVSNLMQTTIRLGSAAFSAIPVGARFLVRLAEWVLPPAEPVSRRLHLYDHNRNQLLEDLRGRGETALVRAVEEREARRGNRQI